MKKLKTILGIIFLLVFIVIGVKVREGYLLYRDALAETPLEEKVNEIKAIENYTTLEEVPAIYTKAVVAVEDHRYYEHWGIDIIAIVRAIWNDIVSKSLVEGGSTITQQLAKNAYFTQEKKLTRKIAEVWMAFEFEQHYSKEEILELYFNTSYYGEGCYTIKEASRLYFDKEPIEMTDAECVMLAGIPNAPSVYNPIANEELAKERQMQVIQKMVYFGVLTEEEAKQILEQ